MRPSSKGILGIIAILACLGKTTIYAESHLYAKDDGVQDLYTLSKTDGSAILAKRFLISQIHTDSTCDTRNDISFDNATVSLIDVHSGGANGLTLNSSTEFPCGSVISPVNFPNAQTVRIAAVSFNETTYDYGTDVLYGTSNGPFSSSREFVIGTSTEVDAFAATAFAW